VQQTKFCGNGASAKYNNCLHDYSITAICSCIFRSCISRVCSVRCARTCRSRYIKHRQRYAKIGLTGDWPQPVYVVTSHVTIAHKYSTSIAVLPHACVLDSFVDFGAGYIVCDDWLCMLHYRFSQSV